jgi:hypothetical protein
VVAEAVAAYQAGVQERLRAAELARTAAQAKAGEERKRGRLTVVLAAAVILIVLGSSGAALWYFDDQARQEREELLRQAEIARTLGMAEQDVRQNLKLAHEAHVKLVEELKTPGGVQSLPIHDLLILDDPASWGAVSASNQGYGAHYED